MLNYCKLVLLFFIANFTNAQNDSLPELNTKILAFVNKNIGKKVDRGECWDLAALPLKANNAKWNGDLIFGRLLDPKKDKILPGDIIQFQNVKVKIETATSIMEENYVKHTAIIYEVLSPTKFKIAQQNTGHKGKKVSIDSLDLTTIIKGKVMIYRPTL